MDTTEPVDDLPLPTPDADPKMVDVLSREPFAGRTLFLSDRYITASAYFDRLMRTMLNDLLLLDRDDHLKRASGDLFDGSPVDGRSVFMIKSAMGSGKTTLLRRYMEGIDAYEKTLPVDAKRLHIVIVICRRALGKMYITMLRDLGFVYYQECTDKFISDDRVICSPESYRRMQHNLSDGRRVFKTVDLLVLDEWVTLMASLNGETMSDRRGLFYTIFERYFMVQSTQVMVMDACLDPSSIGMIQRLTSVATVDDLLLGGMGFEKKIYTVYNSKRSAAPGQIKITQSLEYFRACINKAIAHCVRSEWEARRLEIESSSHDPLYEHPKPRYQVIIAHSSIAKSQALHLTLMEDWPLYLNKRTCALINSTSGGGNLRTCEWEDKLVIQHTSTIACGSDYNPAHHTGRTVFVFSYSSDQIPPDLMCQMTFRARLPIVHTVLFYVPTQNTPEKIVDREQLIDYVEATGSFINVPSIANDRRAYVLAEELIDGSVYHVPRINRNDFGLDLMIDQTMRRNRAQSNYMNYLLDVLADISDEWREARDANVAERLIATTLTPREDGKLKRAERESTKRFIDVVHLEGVSLLMDTISESPTRLAIDTVLEKFDQQQHYINAKSTREGVWVYQSCILMKRLGLRFFPTYAETPLIDLLEDFLLNYKNWFCEFYDIFLLLVSGSKKVTSDCVASYVQSREYRAKAAIRALQVSIILNTIQGMFPGLVIESEDNVALRLLYSCRKDSTDYFDASSFTITSEKMKDADALPIVKLSDAAAVAYGLLFDPLRFPKPIDGRLECLCDPEDAPNPSAFKSQRNFISQVCPQMAHKVLECAGVFLETDATRQFKVTVPYQRKKVATRTYTMAPHSDVPMVCTRLSRLAPNIQRFRADGTDILWAMERPHFIAFTYLPLWDQLC